MMPTISLPDVYDEKLKKLVTDPFEQTRVSIVQDLIDAELKRRNAGHGGLPATSATDTAIRLDPAAPVSLYHTKITSATIDGAEVNRPKWNGVREQIHVIALKRLGSFTALQAASGARLRAGRYQRDGFKYIPDGDFSIQGVDANWCWEHTLQLAKVLKIPLRLRFVWRDKEGAAHPGQAGVLEWSEGPKKL